VNIGSEAEIRTGAEGRQQHVGAKSEEEKTESDLTQPKGQDLQSMESAARDQEQEMGDCQ
jgi:hypothetical protein